MPQEPKPVDGDVHGWWGRYGSPQTGIVYGDSGVGKDTDLMYAFPGGIFLGKPGSNDAWHDTLCLPGQPKFLECNTLDDAILWVHRIRQLPAAQRPIAMLISDISLLALTTQRVLTAQLGYNWDMWREIGFRITHLADQCIAAGVHLWANGHIWTPRQDNAGVFWKGGPELPSKTNVKRLPHAFRNVFKAEVEPDLIHFWQGVYRCDPLDGNWHMKSRMSYRGTLPMNLAELLRARGYTVPRYKTAELDLTWQDAVSAAVFEQRVEGKTLTQIVEYWSAQLLPKVHAAHLQWAIRDGIDRYTISRLSNHLQILQPNSALSLGKEVSTETQTTEEKEKLVSNNEMEKNTNG